jgi:hypothetical protein
MINFDLISDFHLEMNIMNNSLRLWRKGDPIYYAWNVDRKSNTLVMAGDVSNCVYNTRCVLREAAKYYDHVVFVDGNHEHYHYLNKYRDPSVRSNMRALRTFSKLLNITYLDGKTTYRNGNTLFIGANGWYDFEMAYGYSKEEQHYVWDTTSNDSRINFGNTDPVKLAKEQANMIRENLSKASEDDTIENVVVVTHTIPHMKGMINDVTHPWYKLNGAYGCAELNNLLTAKGIEKVKVWCYGHTHFRYDFVDNGIRFVCNPRGYRGERNDHNFDGIQKIDISSNPYASAFGEIED